MRRWVAGRATAVACVVMVASCTPGGGPRPHTVAQRGEAIGPHIPGVHFPPLPPVDGGVLHVDRVITPHNVFPTPADGRGPVYAAGGLRYTVESCELRAPGHWVVRGHVTLPARARAVQAWIEATFSQGDLGHGTSPVVGTFVRSGAYALAVASPQVAGQPIDDAADFCGIDLLKTSAPIDTSQARMMRGVKPTATGPYRYDAPADSLQAMGIGAPLAEQFDPRTVSLYTIWNGATSPLTEAWVPSLAGQPAALTAMRVTKDSPCAQIEVTAETRVVVTTARDCDAPGELGELALTDETVPGAPGFVWAHEPDDTLGVTAVRRVAADEVVVVRATVPDTRADVARVAASRVPRRNLAVAGATTPRPQTLAAAIEAVVARHPGVIERTRFRYRDGWMVVFDGSPDPENPKWWSFSHGEFTLVPSGWTSAGLSSGGGQIACYSGMTIAGRSFDDGEYAVAITADPTWRIQANIDGTWRTLPTQRGVLFVDLTARNHPRLSMETRPVDATGHVPACWTG